MKILLRKFNDEYYVWKTAEWKDNGYYIDNNGEMYIPQVNIIAVKDDDREGSVVCAFCGAKIKNDPESIEKHFAERETSRNCFACEHLTQYGKASNAKSVYTKNEDGTYHVTSDVDTELGCTFNRYYRNPCNIDSTEAKNICQYFQCRKAGVSQINDIFVTNPGAFNKSATVDVLTKNGYTYCGYYNNTHGFGYDMGVRGQCLTACVNEVGIVDHFLVRHRYDVFTVYYSAKYDKLFFDYGGRYVENIPNGLSEAKYNTVKKKIAALYKEA